MADAAERWPAKGRSPADDLEERLAAGAHGARPGRPAAPRCGREHDRRRSSPPPSTRPALGSSRILEPFDEAVLRRQHDILMSPLLWDLAHVANYEDLWLVRALGGEPTRAGLDDLYDAFKQPRNVREALPLLDLGRRSRLRRRRAGRALELLDAADLVARRRRSPHPRRASCTAWSPSTSTSTPRRSSPRSSSCPPRRATSLAAEPAARRAGHAAR